jgi:hypothetical protein
MAARFMSTRPSHGQRAWWLLQIYPMLSLRGTDQPP